MWQCDRYDRTRGLMLRIVALEPLCKNNSKETVYTYADMNWEQDSRRSTITVAHVLSHASSYGICSEKSVNVTAFSPSISDSGGPGSSVGIATDYRLDGPGIESRWRRDFLHTSRPALGPTQPPKQWVPGLSRGVKRPGRGADHPPPSSAEVEN
jgi:hypothetical protein